MSLANFTGYNPLIGMPITSPPQNNYQAAVKELGLNPQEQALYQRHLTNLYGSGGVDNPNGSRSTLYQMSAGVGNKVYNMPTVYEGKILPPDEAFNRAMQEGINQFPSYDTQDEAEQRYQKMHNYMERDTAQYLAGRQR